MSDDNNWISAREAQKRLGRGERQLRNYAQQGRLRSRLHGRRLEYYEPDVIRIAGELPEDDRDRVPEQQIIPAGEMLSHIRDLERQLSEAMVQVGYLRAALDERTLQRDEARVAQRLLVDKEREVVELQGQLQAAQGASGRKSIALWVLAIVVILVIVGAAYFLLR